MSLNNRCLRNIFLSAILILNSFFLAGQEQVQEYDLTPADVFEESITEIIEGLLENPETKGVIATLPYISDLPFFYFRQYNFMRLGGSNLSQARSFTTPFNLAVIAHNMEPDNEK